MENKIYQTIIIGSGPCGIGCACKLKEAGVDFAILEGYMPGGKVNICPRVDNYPNEHEILGPDLAMKFVDRLFALKVPFVQKEVVELTKVNDLFNIKLKNNDILLSKSVVIATGGKEKKLGLENEDRLLGHGISYCAICDGHFFKNKDIVVVADNDHALQEAIYLSNLGKSLTLIIKNESISSTKLYMTLSSKDNVNILHNVEVIKILGEEKVTGITIKDNANSVIKDIQTDALFPLVGQIPNTKFINIPEVVDVNGAIPVNKLMESNVSNLYAGGDVLPRNVKQIYLSEFDGTKIAKSIIEKLGEQSEK